MCVHLVNCATCPALTGCTQLVDDALDLARAGQLNYNTALSLVSYLEREHDFLPWDAAFGNLDFLNTQLRRTAGYGAFQVGW